MLPLLLFLFFVSYVSWFYFNASRYPKGPTPLPLIGNLHQVSIDGLYKQLHEYGKQYNGCFTIFLPRPTVVFTSYELIKETLVDHGDTFNARTQVPPETLLQKEPQTGILIADGEVWREQRRTALRILRDFGLGKGLMEEQVNRSIVELLEQLKATNDGKSPFDMNVPIQLCVGNIINETLFGYHFKYNDSSKFLYFVGVIDRHLRSIRDNICVNLITAWPWLANVPIIGRQGFWNIKKNIAIYQEFIETEIERLYKCYDPDEQPENFVHAYLKEMEKSPDTLDKRQLTASVVDFWIAGMETTGTTLRWALLFLMKYPDVQEKIRSELLSVVGKSRLASMADRPQLPYFTAAVHEIQRCANMIPFLGGHRCLKDTTLSNGAFIPANTFTMPQIWSVMANDDAFADPEVFRPERFLEADGKTLNKQTLERLIVFSVGKRMCVGEGLARMELFLILSALLLNYRFEPIEKLSFSSFTSSVVAPLPYKCRVVPV